MDRSTPSTPIVAAPAEAFAGVERPFREQFDAALEAWLAERLGRLRAEVPEAAELGEAVARLACGGGKRLRPALLEAAWRAGGGGESSRAAVDELALGLELFHTYLLIHDDIMDHAPLRRGQPAAHRAFAERHRRGALAGDAADFGASAAILAGDLAHSWAQELFQRALLAVPETDRRRSVGETLAAMTREVVAGQYLEVLLARRGDAGEDDLARVLRLKSGRYSVERPLELGALLAGARDELLAPLARCGRALGEAFQLQDDVLGTFGEAGELGKPVASDLEEGKLTFLVFHALAAAPPADAARLRAALGRPGLEPEEVEALRRVIEGSGALARVRRMIDERLGAARAALAGAVRAVPEGPGTAAGFAFLAGLVDDLAERRR